jgi:hypothetical protein
MTTVRTNLKSNGEQEEKRVNPGTNLITTVASLRISLARNPYKGAVAKKT